MHHDRKENRPPAYPSLEAGRLTSFPAHNLGPDPREAYWRLADGQSAWVRKRLRLARPRDNRTIGLPFAARLSLRDASA